MDQTKSCTRCNIEKPTTAFYKQSATKDGLQSYCKDCRKSLAKSLYDTPEYKLYNKQNATKWYNNNKYTEKFKRRRNQYNTYYRKTNPDAIFRGKIRNKIKKILKGAKKGVRTHDILGCPTGFLKKYIESQLTPEMSWENYGKLWHIDHIIPLSAFPLTVDGMKQAWHYTNLRPLLAKDNLLKGDLLPSGIRARDLNRMYKQIRLSITQT